MFLWVKKSDAIVVEIIIYIIFQFLQLNNFCIQFLK